MNFRTRYSPRERSSLSFEGVVSRTKQADLPSTDINKILANYMKTGILPDSRRQALYGDFSEVPTYLESMQIVQRAHEQFESLPAQVRDRFSNDPVRFLEFASDPKSGPEMAKLGLATETLVDEKGKPLSEARIESLRASAEARAAEGTRSKSKASKGVQGDE